MQILKTNLIKKEFIDDEKNSFKMKLKNKIKTIENVSKNIIDTIKISFEKKKC